MIKPTGYKVLVEEDKNVETEINGILLPDTAKEKNNRATVIRLGAVEKDYPFEEGDIVIIPPTGATTVNYEDKEYKIFEVDQILAVIK